MVAMIKRVDIKHSPVPEPEMETPYGRKLVDDDLGHAIDEAWYHAAHLHEVTGGYIVCHGDCK